MDHRTWLIILCEICLSVLQSQQVADIINILSICIFCFQCSFSLLFVTIKIALDNLLPIFLAISPGKHTDSHTLTNKTSTTQLNCFFRWESGRDCHGKCVTKLLQSHGERMVSYAKPLSFRSEGGHRYQSNPEFRTAVLNRVSKQLIAAQASVLFSGINQPG